MKKFLMMAFVSVAMMTMVSCSSDDEKDDSTPVSLVGTEWVCTKSYDNIPMVGTVTISGDLSFVSAEKCHAVIALQPSFLPFALPESDFDYTFDGREVQIVTNNDLLGTIVLAYTGESLVYTLPQSQYTSMLPDDKLVFVKK